MMTELRRRINAALAARTAELAAETDPLRRWRSEMDQTDIVRQAMRTYADEVGWEAVAHEMLEDGPYCALSLPEAADIFRHALVDLNKRVDSLEDSRDEETARRLGHRPVTLED